MYNYIIKYIWNHFQFQKLSEDELLEKQLEMLNSIFCFSKKYVPFYHNLYKEYGLMEMTIRSPGDVQKIPIVSKNDFRKVPPKDLIATVPIKGINQHYTSGSTGEPFLVMTTKEVEYTAHIRIFFTLAKYGYRPYYPMLILSRYEPNTTFRIEKDMGPYKFVHRYLKFFRREIVSIYDKKGNIVRKLKQIKPYVFVSTPGILSILIAYLKEINCKFNIPIIFLTSETITPQFLQDIHIYLGRTVIDMYGCMESPSIGYEINGSGKREIFTETCFLELIKERNMNDNYNNVIISNLLNFVQPIIRYQVNDLAINNNKRTMGLRSIGKVIGRIDDIIKTSNGAVIAHHHAYEMFMDFNECKQFKFIQKGDQIILQLVIDKNRDKNKIIEKAKIILKNRYPDVEFNIQIVDAILPDPITGKIKNIEVQNNDPN